MYMIAVLEEGTRGDLFTYIKRGRKTRQQLKSLFKTQDYHLVSVLFTTDKRLFSKKELKVRLAELRRYMDTNPREGDTYVYTLVNAVGRSVQRCLELDIEVTDELAIQCHTFYSGYTFCNSERYGL